MHWIFILQVFATLLMTGIIWFVQIVHYPLFTRVGRDAFTEYETAHATRTGWVVGPLMCIELATALLLLSPSLRPVFVSAPEAWCAAALVGVVWISTGLIQVPLHSRLATSYDASTVWRLVATNWIRTIAWTLRSLLVLCWFAKLLQQS